MPRLTVLILTIAASEPTRYFQRTCQKRSAIRPWSHQSLPTISERKKLARGPVAEAVSASSMDLHLVCKTIKSRLSLGA